jgi:hypothetical protein
MTRNEAMNSAAGHLQTALMLYVEARRDDLAVREGLKRILDLAGGAKVASNATALEQCLADIAATAVMSLERYSTAGSRFEEIAASIGSVRDCLESRTLAQPHSTH